MSVISDPVAHEHCERCEQAAVAGRRRGARARSATAAALVLLSALLAPFAVLGAWAQLQLVDTDRFVQAFAPLAEKPEVQAFVAEQVVQGIEQSVDIDGVVSDLFSGVASLDLPRSAAAALPLLEGAAAQGVRSLIADGAAALVESPRFAVLWQGALRESHARAVSVIQGDPQSVLQLSDEGTLSLSLAVVGEQVRDHLSAQGLGLAALIPQFDGTVPLVTADSLVLVRTVYQVVVAVGIWLPWIVLGALVAGIATSRRRLRTLAYAGVGLAASLLLLAGGLGVGRRLFAASLSPSIMPAATAHIVFDQLTMLLSSTLLALVVLSLLVAVGAWAAGGSRRARALRNACEAGFDSVRRAADRRGIGTGALGRLVERWHSAILVAVVGIGVLALFLHRPIELSGVLVTLLLMLLALLLLQLIRRPETLEAEGPEEREGYARET